MMRNGVRVAGLAALTLVVGVLAGCWGVYYPDKVDPWRSSTDRDIELVSDAVLAKENTSPEWQLGRYVYKRGSDRLLVIANITSWPDKREDGDPLRQKQRITERVWITIPQNTPVGKTLQIEKLEEAFLAGYDVAETGSTGFYIMPNRLLGTITILEERPNEVLMSIDVVCEPERLLSWRYKQVVAVPMSPNGMYAQLSTDDTVKIVGRPGVLEEDEEEPLTTPPSTTQPMDMAPTTQPAEQVEPAVRAD
jgi:hypothetical protein